MNSLRSLSIRWRITLGTLAIAAVLAAAAVVVFRSEVEHILSTTTTTLLHHDASPYVAELSTIPIGPIDPPGRGQLVAVVNPLGVIEQSSLPKGLAAALDELMKLKGDQNSVVSGDDTYRVISRTVTTSYGDWHIVTARNDDSSTLALAEITQALLLCDR
jgi:two-component system OmpR family sensor kinase